MQEEDEMHDNFTFTCSSEGVAPYLGTVWLTE